MGARYGSAGHSAAAARRNPKPWGATKSADFEGTVGQIAEGVAHCQDAGSPARYAFEADGLDGPHLKRRAVKRSTTDVLQKQITLGPKLLQIESPDNATNGLHTTITEKVGPVRVRRLAHLERSGDE